MEKKKYYAITASMKFEKTVLVPMDSVNDIREAIDLVDSCVETGGINLLDEEAECETEQSQYADADGTYELNDKYASSYQIIEEANQDEIER